MELTLSGRSEELKEYRIGAEVLGRCTSFDPRMDTIANRLRSMLAVYYASEGQNDPVIIEIPRGSYVPLIRGKEASSDPIPPVDIAGFPPQSRRFPHGAFLLAAAGLLAIATLQAFVGG